MTETTSSLLNMFMSRIVLAAVHRTTGSSSKRTVRARHFLILSSLLFPVFAFQAKIKPKLRGSKTGVLNLDHLQKKTLSLPHIRQFKTLLSHKRHSFSAPKYVSSKLQFNTNPSVPHVSSTQITLFQTNA